MDRKPSILKKILFILTHISVFVSLIVQDVNAKGIFFLERPKLGIDLSYEFRDEKREGPNQTNQDLSHDFRESLEIQTNGWVYHPALMKYTLSFLPEWNQRIDERKAGGNYLNMSDDRNAFLYGYFMDTTLLESKPFNLYLYSRKSTSPISSAFAQSSETDADNYGARVRLKIKTLPTDFGFNHIRSSQTGFYESERINDEFRLNVRTFHANIDASLESTYNENIRNIRGFTTWIKTSENDLENSYAFMEDGRVKLDSFLSYRWTESDYLNTTAFRLTERLDWKHKKKLSSYYTLNYNRNDSDGFITEKKSVNANLTHSLYENLTTTFEGDVAYYDFGEDSEKTYGLGLNFNYLRDIPWGSMNIGINYDYDIASRSNSELYIPVIEEPIILANVNITFLNNENVDLGPIVVTNATGTTIYVENTDYTLDEVNSFVRIARTTFGGIADGDTVLVSYRYLSNPDFDDTMFGQTYYINFNLWSVLRLSYRYNHSVQRVSSGIPPDRLVDDAYNRVEIQYNWKCTETRLSYDEEDRSSGISNSTRLAEETLTLRPMRDLFFKFSGRYGKRKLSTQHETEEFYGYNSNLDWALNRWCHFKIEGFRNYSSGTLQDTENMGILSSIELSHGIWSCNLEYRYSDENDDLHDDRRTFHNIYFEIIRVLW